MARRVATIVRRGLLVVGVVVLLWMPVSYLVSVEMSLPWPASGVALYIDRGWSIATLYWSTSPIEWKLSAALFDHKMPLVRPDWPHWRNFGLNAWEGTSIFLPLWLPAAVCLAWPVISFIASRRRARRGFPVSPAADRDTPAGRDEHPGGD